MPSHGLMKADRMSEADAAFIHARVLLPGSIDAGQESTSRAGITTLYEAIFLGMRDYIARHEECASFVENADLWDAAVLYQALVRAGVFDDPLRFNRISLMVERAVWQGTLVSEDDSVLREAESMLTRLEVIALERSALPGNSTSARSSSEQVPQDLK
jgi:hypothetical protein